jgi:glycyl-tRNA synthetase
MKSFYNANGLIFWSEQEIACRDRMLSYFVEQVTGCLKAMNRAFEVVRIEAPLLMPSQYLNKEYDLDKDVFAFSQEFTTQDGDKGVLCLRPETTRGTYEYAKWLLSNNGERRKYKLPLCVYQFGKSFRNEKDKTLEHMRLKEFYQLEFQIFYSKDTLCDYSVSIIDCVASMIELAVNAVCRVENSDRLPSYSSLTKDVLAAGKNLELCSISKRTDFEGANVLEVAIGMDRCLYINQLSQKFLGVDYDRR